MTRKFTFMILAMMFAILGPGAEAWGQAGNKYVKVTSAPTDWSGEYLLVYESSATAGVAWTGVDAASCNVAVTISSEEIAEKPNNAVTITIATMTGGYSIKVNGGTNNGKYIKGTSGSNALGFDNNAQLNTISYDATNKGVLITSNTSVMRYNNASNNYRFRYFKSSSYSSQKIVQLYKKEAGTPSTTPTCTIDPTSYDFGEIAIGGSAEYEFTVTTADLTGNLTLAVSEGFSVSPATIESTETERTVTITCAPTAVGALDGTLTISGGGLTDDVTATLSATGLCTAPENELAYTTPVELQLTAGEAEATLAPIENTGNGGTITYELIAGDKSHLLLEENTGEIYTNAIGSYTVRATQAVNGTICGGTFDIVINVTSTSPSCSVSPSEWNFGNVAIGTSASKTFTVTTANLTDDLTVGLSMGETTYSVTPTTISQSATSTDVTVTFTPVEDGLVEELLTISGGGLTSAVEVVLSATGISPYTVTFVAVNGDAPQAAIVEQGSSITLGTVENVDCNTWQFAGWSESETFTEAPTLLAGGNYTPTENVTLYAVYKKAEASEPTQVPFVFADIAEANDWKDAQAYTSVVIDPVTITANGGGNNGKYYTSDKTWRMYNGGSVTITSTGNNITAVSSDPSTTFSINNGEASLNFNATTKFKSITVTCTPPTSFSYSTTPSCLEIVATPTITPNGGEFFGSQEITLGCTTEGATISYTFDNWETSIPYSTPFTINETTTIKAKANKDGMSESEEASATFTKVPVLETIQAIFDASATAGNYYVKFNNYVVSGVTSSNAYITDGEKGFIVYKSSHGFAVGDILNGTVQLALTRYNGAAEFTNLTSSTTGLTVTPGGSITPVEPSIADLGGVNTGAVITLNNVTHSGNDMFTDGAGNEIKAYKTFMALPTFIEGCNYNMTGVYIQYNTTKEIAPRRVADIQLIVAAPTFTPEGGDYNAAQNVEIASATAGAAIYYTLDGSDPTVESTLYSAPIELSETTTLKAIAAKAGSVSKIATAVYTITITTVATPTFDPEGGSYFNESLEVSLDCATNGATIVYTTDNWSTQTTYSYTFPITETTTVKAKATKAGMDDSGIAEATYTKRYKVDYVVNGDATAVAAVYITPGEALGTLPTATAPNGYTFRGWSKNEVTLTDAEPAYVTAETVPTGDMTLYAVFAIATKRSENNEYSFAIQPEDFNGTSYNANNGSHDFTATCTTDDTKQMVIACTTYQVMMQDGAMQWQKNAGYIYNTTDLGTIKSVEVNSTAGAFTTYYGTSEHPTSGTTVGNGFFTVQVGDATGKTSSVVVTFEQEVQHTTYSNFCTTVKTLSGTITQSDITANTAYYISGVTTINSAVEIAALTNDNPANLIIEDGAQLILNEKNIGVMATVKKQIEASNRHTDEPVDRWYTIGSPVNEPIINGSTGNYVADIIPAGGMSALTYDLYYLDMTAGTWINYRQEGDTPGFTTLENGRGYIYSNQSATTVKYVGELNTANVNRSVNTGWNLVSNPFAQTIAFSNFKLDYSAMDGYYSLDGAGGWQAEPITTVVASNTGILVNVPEGASSIEISKPAKAIENNGAKRGDSNDNAYAYIEINVANANYSDRAYAAFAEGYGLPKYDHINAEIQKVYIPQDGEDFAIAMMDENVTLFPVNFKAMTTGYYTISLKSSQIYEGYNDFDYLHLIDNMTGEEIDMLLEDGYKFAASPKDNAGRFTVKLHRNGIEENDIENINFVYQNGNELVINGEGAFQLIDMLGRVVISKEVHGETVNVGSLNTGAYIVRMIGNEVKTQKIVIK